MAGIACFAAMAALSPTAQWKNQQTSGTTLLRTLRISKGSGVSDCPAAITRSRVIRLSWFSGRSYARTTCELTSGLVCPPALTKTGRRLRARFLSPWIARCYNRSSTYRRADVERGQSYASRCGVDLGDLWQPAAGGHAVDSNSGREHRVSGGAAS